MKFNEYIDEKEYENEIYLLNRNLDEVEEALDNFEKLDETKKSQLVAKLIGLGYMEKDSKTGKLKIVKDVPDDFYSRLKKKKSSKKKIEKKKEGIGKKVKSVLKGALSTLF